MDLRVALIDGLEELNLKLLPDTKVNFEFNNPSFDFEALVGSFSMGLKIPISGNEAALEFAHHVHAATGDLLYAMRLYSRGELRVEGHLLLETSETDFASGFYDCSLIATDFASQIEALGIRDVCDEEITIGTGLLDVYTEMKSVAEGSYPTYSHTFPVCYNPDHFNGKNENFDGLINRWAQAGQVFIHEKTLNLTTEFYENYSTFSPFMYLMWVLDKCFSPFGYKLEGEFVDDDQIKQALLESNFTLEKWGHGWMMYAERTNTISLHDTWLNFDNIIEETNPGVTTGATPYEIAASGKHKVRIELNIGTLTAAWAKFYFYTSGTTGTGVVFQITTGGQAHVMEEVVEFAVGDIGTNIGLFVETSDDSDVEVLANSRLRVDNITHSSGFDIQPTFNAANAIPKLSIADFIISIRKLFNLQILINPVTKVATFNWAKSALSNSDTQLLEKVGIEKQISRQRSRMYRLKFDLEQEDFSGFNYIGAFATQDDLPTSTTVGSIALIQNMASYFIYVLNEDDETIEWQQFVREAVFKEYGSGQVEEVNLGAILTKMTTAEYAGEKFLVPWLEDKGSSFTHDLGIGDGRLAILFGHGKQQGSDGLYPFASPFDLDYDGSSIGDYSLAPNGGAKSIFDLFWEDWIAFLNQMVEIEVDTLHSSLDVDVAAFTRTWLNDNSHFLIRTIDQTYSGTKHVTKLTIVRK